jgi:hypothetical protein
VRTISTCMRIGRMMLAVAGCAGGAAAAAAQDGPRTGAVDLAAYKNVVYVSAANGSDGAGRGTKQAPWASVSAALAALAKTSQPTAVLVAEGSYPTENLQMVSGVDLYGGFDAADWSRDVWGNRTTLDGKGEGRVLVAADRATLDGFEIRGGAVRGTGGGVRIDGTSPVISNNIFIGNKTLGPQNWKPRYWHETANDGGALYCTNGGAPTVTHNLFVDNRTENGRGAAIALDHRCKGRIADNVIMENVAGLDDPMRSSDGGGISVFNWSAPIVEHNVVLNNKALARNDAGGIFVALWSSAEVRDNLIVGNEAGDDAGGLFVGGQEHRYDAALDPMPPASDYFVKVIDNRFFGNDNSSHNSGATRITMETRGLIEGNIAAYNSGFYLQRTETRVVNNTILENLILIESKDYLKPSIFDKNIVWGSIEYDTKAIVTNSLFRDGFKGNETGEPSFIDDERHITPFSVTYAKDDHQTRMLLADPVDPTEMEGRAVFGDGKWAVIKDATANSLTLWGDMRGVRNLTIVSRYRQTADSKGAGKGADAVKKKPLAGRPNG